MAKKREAIEDRLAADIGVPKRLGTLYNLYSPHVLYAPLNSDIIKLRILYNLVTHIIKVIKIAATFYTNCFLMLYLGSNVTPS